jgi:hypothetical protein
LFALYSFLRLSEDFISDKILRSFAAFSALPLILMAAFAEYGADLLSAALLMLYLKETSKLDFFESKKGAVITGIIGGLAYFSKAFSLPFFLTHLTIIHFLHYHYNKNDSGKILKHWSVSITVLALLTSFWITAISYKYNQFTYSMAGEYGLRLDGSESKGNPIDYVGLIPPPNPTALSSWEDPSLMMGYMKPWNPFGSFGNFTFFLKKFFKNSIHAVKIYNFFTILSFLIVIGGVVLTIIHIRSADGYSRYRAAIHLLIALIVYTFGYLFFFQATRYFYFTGFLLMILSYVLLGEMGEKIILNHLMYYLAAVLISGSFIYKPFMENYEYYFGKSGENAEIRRFAKVVYSLTNSLSPVIVSGRMASNADFNSSNMIAYLLHNKYFGITKKAVTEIEVKDELVKYGIDYYLVWDRQRFNFLNNCAEVPQAALPVLKIYLLKPCLYDK